MSNQDRAPVSELAENILSRILAGEFPPGKPLRQEALAEQFEVSRTPVREALRQLEARGVVVQRPGFGATVRDLNARDVREAYQVRAELEGLATELAVDWLTDEQLERIRAAQTSFKRAVDILREAPNGLQQKLRPPSRQTRHGLMQTTPFTRRSLPPAAICVCRTR